jgi:hypothetical protein
MELSKIALAISSLCLLNGCLKVEDNSNDDLVAALQEQNRILAEQQQPPAQLASTVAIRGIIIDSYDQLPVNNAKITVKIGSEVIVSVQATSIGEFSAKKLPANSDIEVIVSSDNAEFLTRAFFFNTGSSTSGEAQRDFGTFEVSEGVEIAIEVLDSASNQPLTNLVFEGSSNVGTSSSNRQYLHTSSFDEVTGTYLVTIPKYLSVTLYASVDFDKDGKADFAPEQTQYRSGTNLYVNSINAKTNPTIYVAATSDNDLVNTTPIEFRIAIVDSQGEPIEGAEIQFNDSSDAKLSATYDPTSTQYVVNTNFRTSGNFAIPAFTANGVNYQSSSISISSQSNGSLYVNQNANSYSSFNLPKSDVIELAIQPKLQSTSSSDLNVVFKSEINPSDNGFSVFYSQAINVSSDSITLNNSSAFSVTRGNASTNDLVLPGVTVITGGKLTPVTATQSLNNTKLSIIPNESLISGLQYSYSVGLVEIVTSKLKVDINNDSISFTVPFAATDVFDINDLRLDNNNYTTNGEVITPTNTAGEASTASNNKANPYVIFPANVNNLQEFSLRQMLVAENGVTRTDINYDTIIDNGNLSYNVSRRGSIAVAINEQVFYDNYNSGNIWKGLNLSDTQQIYTLSTSEYLSDNLADSENSITFEYAYQTKAGEIVTGTITLPVN